jgi:D-alanyl-lipoteichoic acid acyltransferase DltB (MBOAT superfamily)
LYIPLGGSRGGTWMKVRNTFIIFIVSGFWHGANWTFIVWGALNAIYFLPLLLLKKNRVNTNTVAEGRSLPSPKEFFQMSITFSLTVLAWVFFRAENIEHALSYLATIFSKSLFSIPHFPQMRLALTTIILIAFFIIVEWIGRNEQFAIQNMSSVKNNYLRYAIYVCIIILIMTIGNFNENQFIYFQF